jgi:hypothetical protein
MFFVYLSAEVFAGLATAEEMAKGASVAQEGLAVPPPREPAPSALANRPSPADVLGPGEFPLFWFQRFGLFLAFYSKVRFCYVQVLLNLRSQVGLMPCARFIPWSEVSVLASAKGFLFLTMVFLNCFWFTDRFRQKLRGMDFDTLLRVQYEHHSLVSLRFVVSSFAVFHSEVCCNYLFLRRVITWLPP